MHSIKYKNIGAITVIDYFAKLPVDGELTRLSTKAAIEKLPESTKLQEKLQVKTAYLEKVREANTVIKRANDYIVNAEANFGGLTEAEKPEVLANMERARASLDSWTKKRDVFQKQVDACDPDISSLSDVVATKEREHKTENAIYCHPRKNEVVPTPEQLVQYKALFDGKSEHEQVKIQVKFVDKVVVQDPTNGDITAPIPELTEGPLIIADYIGCQYFWKVNDVWQNSEVISELGIVKEDVARGDSIEKNDLTPEQTEEVRIQGLSVGEEAAEKQVNLDQALQESINMKAGLEIQGSTPEEATSAARAWYDEQVLSIEAKYA